MKRRTFLIKTLKSGALIASGSMVPALSTWGQQSERRPGGTLVVASTGYRTLNPAVQSGATTGIVGSQIFAGLVQMDNHFKPQPYLARKWEIAADGLTYTFHLVEGATFHDGKPITSADVAFSFMATKEYHPFGKQMFGALSRVETPDAATAVLKLKEPAPYLMQALQPFLMPVLPKHIYDNGQPLNQNPHNVHDVVGSGPFKVVENKPGEHLLLQKYDKFFRRNRPYLDRVLVKIIKDPATNLLTFSQGKIDYEGDAPFPFRDIVRLKKQRRDLQFTTKGYEATGLIYYLNFNLRRKPFSDLRVRQAISHAVNRDWLAKVLFQGQLGPSEGPLSSTNRYYDGESLVRYSHNLQKAKTLLDDAGLKPNGSGIRFNFTLDVAPWSAQIHTPIAGYIKSQLKRIGVNVTLRQSPDFSTWAHRVAGWDYEAATDGSWNYPDPVIGVNRLYVCSNIRHVVWTNTEGYCNKKVDEILSQAAVTMDGSGRKRLYAKFQHLVTTDLPFVFLLEGGYTTGYHSYVKNTPLSVWGPIAPYDDIYVEK